MDQYSRRIMGFAVQPIAVDGPALCRMFKEAVTGATPPTRLGFDHDPLFEFLQWKAHLSILGIDPVTTVPHVPVSHPFVERLIGTIRREYLDHLFLWNGNDLQRKLETFQIFYNEARTHQGIAGAIPNERVGDRQQPVLSFNHYTWKRSCGGLAEMPVAA